MKITLRRLQEFLNAAYNRDPQSGEVGFMHSHKDNEKTKLGECISEFSKKYLPLMNPYYNLVDKYNVDSQELKNHYASQVEITENTQTPGALICKYTYAADKDGKSTINLRNQELSKLNKKLQDDQSVVLETEVEVEPVFCGVCPAKDRITENQEKLFMGLVIGNHAV